jgi:hypothetical protein
LKGFDGDGGLGAGDGAGGMAPAGFGEDLLGGVIGLGFVAFAADEGQRERRGGEEQTGVTQEGGHRRSLLRGCGNRGCKSQSRRPNGAGTGDGGIFAGGVGDVNDKVVGCHAAGGVGDQATLN